MWRVLALIALAGCPHGSGNAPPQTTSSGPAGSSSTQPGSGSSQNSGAALEAQPPSTCGRQTPAMSCAHTDGTECEDWSGTAASNAAYQSDCQGRSGRMYSPSPCSHVGAVGGCAASIGGCLVTWSYSGDAASQQAGCESAGGTWITP